MSATTGKPAFRAGRDTATLSENIELLTGQRGDLLDKAITRRELAAIGLANLRRLNNNSYVVEIPQVGTDDSIERPVAPQNVEANGAFHAVLVEWDKPAYSGHSYAEIWRAEEDNLSKAVMVGTTAANVFSDAIGKGAHVWYWVRFVNRNNITGPWNAVAGTEAQTSRDVQDILDEIEGKIQYSHLTAWLRQDIETQSQTAAELVATIADLDREMRDKGLMILDEYRVITDQFSTLVTQIEAIRVQAADAVALVAQEQTGRVTQDQALAQSINSVSTSFSTETAQFNSRCDDLEYAYSDPEGAIAKKFTQVTANMTSADNQLGSAITQESQARASAVEAVASNLQTTVASLNGVSSAVQVQSEAIATINQDGSAAYRALWGAKAQVGDITAGIGLMVDSQGNSQVMIAASSFYVFDPNSSAPTAPLFAIDGGVVVINTAIIRKATIQILNAEKITADYVKAAVSLSSPIINGGRIEIGSNFIVNENGEMAAWGASLRYVVSQYGVFDYATINYATMKNCVIEEDCTVKGTIYAEKIVGDVAAVRSLDVSLGELNTADISFTVNSSATGKKVIIDGISGIAQGFYYASGSPPPLATHTISIRYFCNGVLFKTQSVTADIDQRILSGGASHSLPANTTGVYKITLTSEISGSSMNHSKPLGKVFSLGGAKALVTKPDIATFR